MAWQRGGDTGATYPKLMAARGDKRADERTINELAGFVWRLSMQAAAHLTDYVLDPGTIEMIGGARTPELVRLACKTGLLTKVPGGHKLIEDPDFIHLRSRAEVERERQQRNDTRLGGGLVIPVRRRDGDNCRWCGIGVVWRGRKTKRSGEMDHLHPDQLGKVPTTVADLVVSCLGCNRGRSGNVAEWDATHELLPAPARPNYGTWTAELLTENGYPTSATTSDERPALAVGAEPAPDGVRPATSTSDGADAQPEVASEVDEKSVPRFDRTSPAGSGRVGSASGQYGSGVADVSALPPAPPPGDRPARTRRGRRGGNRNRKTGGNL